MSTETIVAPFGPPTLITPTQATGAVKDPSTSADINIVNALTEINLKTTQATGNRTIAITMDAQIRKESIINILSKSNGTETLTPGTGFTSPALTGVAGKTFLYVFKYMQTTSTFCLQSSQQLD